MLSGFDIFPTLKANQPTNSQNLTLISLLTFVFTLCFWLKIKANHKIELQLFSLCVGLINIDIVDFLTKSYFD